MSHIDHDELASYVAGLVPVDRATAIEAHVETCDACHARVMDEARLEQGLHEVSARPGCVGCDRVVTGDRCGHCGAAMRAGELRILAIRVQNQHGRLYLAEDATGARVALKELCFMQPPSFDGLDAFEREARILCALHHAYLPRFISSFQIGEGVHTRLYLAQELIEGESLEERLANNYFTEAEATEIARQVLDILAFLQQRSPVVIHRDVKPANLIRRPDGKIVLVDFGAARDQGSTAGATQVGTFGYMPIEQLAGLVDATTDVYALGISLMRLLSRREPWKLLDGDPWRHMNISPRLRRVLRRMTERRPEDRYPSAAAALRDVIELAHPRPRRRAIPLAVSIGLSVTVTLGAAAMIAAAVMFIRGEPDAEPPAPQARIRARFVDAAPMIADAAPGGLRPDEIEDMARRNNAPFAQCFMRAARGPDALLIGEIKKIPVTIAVEADGTVIPASPIGDLPASLSACLTAVMTGWRFRPSDGGMYRFTIVAPPETIDEIILGGCDDVSCVISNYAGPCCEKFKRGHLAEGIDRDIITKGVAGVRAAIQDCGNRSAAKGVVKVSVRVAPEGHVASVVVKETPDAALGTCVANAMQRATFQKTAAGGSFLYPFVY